MSTTTDLKWGQRVLISRKKNEKEVAYFHSYTKYGAAIVRLAPPETGLLVTITPEQIVS
ncbi:MAG: hypothetical protein K2G53_09965 [Muribaculaceae bacterium]|nr:hypothetical protein [Muribaculaceae bacterium]